jgi:KaiC/GvpD/RAD55 family RecA-like ATPase
VEGIQKFDEPGILVTLEQSSEEIRSDMETFGFDLKKFEEDGKLVIIDTSLSKIGLKEYITNIPGDVKGSFSLLPDEFDIEKIVALTIQAAKKIGAKRVVIDSLPALDYLVEEIKDIRKNLINLYYQFKSNGLTALVITECLQEDGLTRHGVEEYIADGLVILRLNEALDTRTIRVHKMRVTKHTLKPTTFSLSDKGVKVETKKGL